MDGVSRVIAGVTPAGAPPSRYQAHVVSKVTDSPAKNPGPRLGRRRDLINKTAKHEGRSRGRGRHPRRLRCQAAALWPDARVDGGRAHPLNEGGQLAWSQT